MFDHLRRKRVRILFQSSEFEKRIWRDQIHDARMHQHLRCRYTSQLQVRLGVDELSLIGRMSQSTRRLDDQSKQNNHENGVRPYATGIVYGKGNFRYLCY